MTKRFLTLLLLQTMPKIRSENILGLLRVLLATLYLVLIVLTTPLSFEIGGLECGLSYSISILLLYFVLATIRVLKCNRILSSFLYYLQHLLLPSLLFTFLSYFKENHRLLTNDILQNIWWNYIISSWKFFLVNSTPLFIILEGFCSLLLIQAVGQISTWLVRNKSDTLSILNLMLSSIIISSSLYFVLRIYVSTTIGSLSASLLGSILTLTTILSIYGIMKNKASPLESSLLISYIVKCIYDLFPELSQHNINNLIKFIMKEFTRINEHSMMINKNFITSLSNAYHNYNYSYDLTKLEQYYKIVKYFSNKTFEFLTESFPQSFESIWEFLKLSSSNLTLPIILSLAYRIGVFFAATKIIPILQPNNRNFKNYYLKLIYLYSPCIIIAVYTNLMLQYNDELDKENDSWNWVIIKLSNFGQKSGLFNYEPVVLKDDVHSWQFWNWINIFLVLSLYFIELQTNNPDDNLTSNWET